VNFPFEKASASPEETTNIAAAFADIVNEGETIILNGNLGAGKTYFIKQVCKKWNIRNVSSPSFAIVNSYGNSKTVYHFDFYRIKKREELFEIGFNDYLNDRDAIIFIEWGNLFQEVLPQKRTEINIKILENTKRNFTFSRIE
jgi:tRNA threonylcarbamoyladenosine biosynthesis protein TsaE